MNLLVRWLKNLEYFGLVSPKWSELRPTDAKSVRTSAIRTRNVLRIATVPETRLMISRIDQCNCLTEMTMRVGSRTEIDAENWNAPTFPQNKSGRMAHPQSL
jgi:hypothetical protein